MSIIIKSTRIKTKSGPTNITRHLLDKVEDNEAIELIKGNRADMVDAFDSARHKAGKPSKYALRHWIINSTEKMTDQQFKRTLQALADEFAFNIDDAVVVRHTKEKDTDDKDISNQHYHITVPEILENGKVLSDKKNYQRHEKLSRTLENEFGFSHVIGKHNKAVAYATADLNPEVSAIASKLAQEPLPKQKYTHKALQEAKRQDIDIKKLCRIAKNSCEGITDYQELQEKLLPLNMQIIDGQYKRKDGKLTPVISTLDSKFIIGSVASILKMNQKEITDIIEQKENSVIKLHLSDMPESAPVDVLEAVNNGVLGSLLEKDDKNDSQDSAKNRSNMPESKKSFEDVIKEEQEKLLTIINASHPDLIEESSMSIKQRIKHEFKNQFNELKENKEEVFKLRNKIKDLKDTSSFFNNNKKTAKELEENELKESIEKAFLLAVCVVKNIGHYLGLCEGVESVDLLTQSEREQLLIQYHENQLAQKMLKNEKTREEGIDTIANRVAMEKTDKIKEWQDRPEAKEARRIYNRLGNLLDQDLDDLDKQGVKEFMKAKEASDPYSAIEAVTASNQREKEEYIQSIQDEPENGLNQHVQAVQNKPKNMNLTPKFG
ncbi:hypothetical protein FKW31_02350 [Acetobacter sp. DmW_136]|uniref:relaxase/mobilization nuclease domain-containing protein n=1 Tax=Acetobacter sp. DmW_136 TaxID=2591091 RepID=UPI001238A916|nr:hypothetical protein [Acetobacter sp. DmW_136]KAA8388018.1 hypothetical protein FKW31_02350 [Acetobacter sp. DmW_136]